jgi:uncharacterized membrane protein YuzA (DUF378 family)
MPGTMMGLLVAVGTVMSALVGLTHSDLVPVMIASAAVTTGLTAYLALPAPKKSLSV